MATKLLSRGTDIGSLSTPNNSTHSSPSSIPAPRDTAPTPQGAYCFSCTSPAQRHLGTQLEQLFGSSGSMSLGRLGSWAVLLRPLGFRLAPGILAWRSASLREIRVDRYMCVTSNSSSGIWYSVSLASRTQHPRCRTPTHSLAWALAEGRCHRHHSMGSSPHRHSR